MLRNLQEMDVVQVVFASSLRYLENMWDNIENLLELSIPFLSVLPSEENKSSSHNLHNKPSKKGPAQAMHQGLAY